MRPFRSFLLLLIIIASLSGLVYLFPGSRLFPPLSEFIPELKPESAGIEQVNDTIKVPEPDSLTIIDTTGYSSTTVSPLYYLKPFIDTLQESEEQIRIMYYGDSQVEGDRITFFLRQLLREGREGTGPGLFLPSMPVMYTKSIWLKSSANWERYNYISYREGTLSHNRFGPLMTICRYLPEGTVTDEPVKAYVRIRPSVFADSAAARYEFLRLFYSNVSGKIKFIIKASGTRLFTGILEEGDSIREIQCNLNGANDITIEFEGKSSPDVFGISIESRKGVIVDNIPRRGSAGLEFTMVDRENLEESLSLLDPDLIVLQYGLNIVKNVRKDYSYYKKGLLRQLALLREISPSATLLVVGVTDMAAIDGDTIRSYSNIPAIIAAQREAALESGAAFWDPYEAMGGNSSIIKWAEKNPPLAQTDYVHVTYPGADTLSGMLAEAMLKECRDKEPEIVEVSSVTPEVTPEIEIKANEPIRNIISRVFRYDENKPFIFTAPAFWLFLLFVLAGYSLFYKKLFLRHFYLLAVSLFFYYKSGGFFLILLLLITIVDFTCGLLMYRSGKKSIRRIYLIISLLSNLGILAYFKYTGFFIEMTNNLLGTSYHVHDFLAAFSNIHLGTSFDVSSIILPVGISFFTFQSLSYTIDVYRSKLEPVRNIVDFGFYVSFFPQLVAGPIVRASEFIPQLYRHFSLSKREFSHALFLISKGLIKKIIISDFIAANFVDRIFNMPSLYSGFENLMGIYGYGLQIYCDFSGYTDIAIGIALILGFRLPVNFNSPYKANSISDFWKRWHISLSRWLKDYLYIPLGGNRKGSFRTGLNLMITMLLGGLWHGAALRFVIWGGLHGLGLVINKIWNSLFGSHFRQGRFRRAIAVFITFNFVTFCWIFFRAQDMDTVRLMLDQVFNNFSPGSYMDVLPAYANVFLLMIAGYVIHFLPDRVKESYRGLFIRIPLVLQIIIIMFIAVILFRMRTTEIMPFIYFRF